MLRRLKSRAFHITLATLALALFLCTSGALCEVQPSMLNQLLLGTEDFAAPVYLQKLESKQSISGATYSADWFGPKGSGFFAKIEVSICESSKKALADLINESKRYAIASCDVSSSKPFSQLGKKCFFWAPASTCGGRIAFVHGNVFCNISGTRSRSELLSLAKSLAMRVKAADTDRPLAVRALPISYAEFGGPNRWSLVDYGKREWGSKRSSVVIQFAGQLPRQIHAKRIGNSDYLVPVQSLAIATKLGLEWRTKDNRGLILLGKQVTVSADKKTMMVDGKAVKLRTPIELVGGRITLPVSILTDVFGMRVAWSKVNGVSTARISFAN